MDRKFSIRQVAAIVTAAVTAAVCLTIFLFFTVNSFSKRYIISFDADSVNYKNISKFNRVREILKKDFYRNIDENKMIEGAINGLVESLNDPYTVYFNKDEMKAFMEKSQGSYVGIGVTVNVDENGLLTVIEPFENSPAKSAGIKQGDKIIRVNDKDVTEIRDENMIISMIKGKENTKVNITVYRPEENRYLQFDIVRKRIRVSNIKSEILDGEIGYTKLVMFDTEIAKYFKNDLNKMLNRGIKGLIIDLRDNPGGSYEQVIEIADSLLPEGIIVYTEDRNGKKNVRNSDKRNIGLPLAILTNGNSASASEILAGAIKDHARGTIVGTRTFGKGLVQELKMLDDGSGLKVTVSRYFTPSGACIHGSGIEPDIVIDVPDEYRNMPVSQIPRNADIQLKAAIEAVKGEINPD
ncbi:MAG: S41 family peptidase [Acetivibrionales bacterium]|jgi:carboxyl-terminal processing protease